MANRSIIKNWIFLWKYVYLIETFQILQIVIQLFIHHLASDPMWKHCYKSWFSRRINLPYKIFYQIPCPTHHHWIYHLNTPAPLVKWSWFPIVVSIIFLFPLWLSNRFLLDKQSSNSVFFNFILRSAMCRWNILWSSEQNVYTMPARKLSIGNWSIAMLEMSKYSRTYWCDSWQWCSFSRRL